MAVGRSQSQEAEARLERTFERETILNEMIFVLARSGRLTAALKKAEEELREDGCQ